MDIEIKDFKYRRGHNSSAIAARWANIIDMLHLFSSPLCIAVVLTLQDKLLLRLDDTEHIRTSEGNEDDNEVKLFSKLINNSTIIMIIMLR